MNRMAIGTLRFWLWCPLPLPWRTGFRSFWICLLKQLTLDWWYFDGVLFAFQWLWQHQLPVAQRVQLVQHGQAWWCRRRRRRYLACFFGVFLTLLSRWEYSHGKFELLSPIDNWFLTPSQSQRSHQGNCFPRGKPAVTEPSYPTFINY